MTAKPESLTLIGDVHGHIDRYLEIVNGLDGYSVQLGDMGIGFTGVFLPHLDSWWRNKFIRGNHDNPDKSRKHPLYLGEYGQHPNFPDVFFVSGAYSIDKEWRVPGVSWWPDEELSWEQLQYAIDLYDVVRPRVVLSHEAPTIAVVALLRDLVGPYFNEKKDCKNSRTSVALQEMFKIHHPEQWIFGHYHMTRQFQVYGTTFQCVGELDKITLPVHSAATEGIPLLQLRDG